MTSESVTVRDNPGQKRFELYQGDALAGHLDYTLRQGRLTLIHTEIDPASGGRGLGSRLVSGVLDEARARGQSVDPVCPFVRRYLERHPEYGHLVAT